MKAAAAASPTRSQAKNRSFATWKDATKVKRKLIVSRRPRFQGTTIDYLTKLTGQRPHLRLELRGRGTQRTFMFGYPSCGDPSGASMLRTEFV